MYSLFFCAACVSAYVPATVPRGVARAAAPTMSEESIGRREVFSKVLGSAALLSVLPANAEIDYAGVGFLGGSSTIDVKNANVRVYSKLPGMYPTVAGKLIKYAPYKSAAEMYTKGGFSSTEAAVLKKYESRFIFLEPKPEYQIDQFNN